MNDTDEMLGGLLAWSNGKREPVRRFCWMSPVLRRMAEHVVVGRTGGRARSQRLWSD